MDEIIDFERVDLKEFLIKLGVNEEKLLEIVNNEEEEEVIVEENKRSMSKEKYQDKIEEYSGIVQKMTKMDNHDYLKDLQILQKRRYDKPPDRDTSLEFQQLHMPNTTFTHK